ncbi:MAG: hypothetical protein HY916_08075 [Desulfovibrio sp.]|jgi:hypothetical protein|nr:hypothetical protein [Desulfovibrio sp.]
MRKICSGLLAAALVLGLAAAQPAEAKVYKMSPEERSAALKEKKSQKAKSKKSGKAAPGADQGGWVEVKPGEKIAKKNRQSKVDELAKAAEDKGKKKKSKKAAEEAPAKASEEKGKKSKKAKAAGSEETVVEKKSAKAAKAEKKSTKAEQADGKSSKKSGRKSASRGDRVVGSNYSGSKVSASSAEVRRPAGSTAPAVQGGQDELNSYSVSRPGQEPKAAAVPEVRHEVQTGPVDASKPIGTEHKAGEGRF